MKNVFAVSMMVVGLSVFGALSAFADDEPVKTLLGDVLKDKGIDVTVSGTTDVYNKYVWRGFLLDADTVVQPSFSISSYGVTFSAWGSFDAQQADGLSSDEIDTTLSYGYTFKELVTVSAGHTYYDFRGAHTYSKEFFVALGVDTILKPTVTAYFDYGDEDHGGGDGQYYALDVSHSFTLNKEYGVALNLGGHVGLNNELYLNGDGGDALLSAGLSVPLTSNLSMALKGAYAIPFGDLEDPAIGNQNNQFYSGVSLGYSF